MKKDNKKNSKKLDKFCIKKNKIELTVKKIEKKSEKKNCKKKKRILINKIKNYNE
jgi:hypothetical protein